MIRSVTHRLARLEQTRAAIQARESAPPVTIVFVGPDRRPVSAIRWSREEKRYIDAPLPPDKDAE